MNFNMSKPASAFALAGAIALCSAAMPSGAGDLSVNGYLGTNYLWRGMSLTEDHAAIQAGIDYEMDRGLYAGTWITSANYGIAGVNNYQQDFYGGYAFDLLDVRWDLGYRYYTFDLYEGGADTDFGEAYFRANQGGFTGAVYVFTNSEAEDEDGEDFDAGSSFYVSADYDFEIGWGTRMGFHLGFHDGDFAETFVGSDEGYWDYNVSFAKNGFKLMIADTNVTGPTTEGAFDNDDPKVVLSYSIKIDL